MFTKTATLQSRWGTNTHTLKMAKHCILVPALPQQRFGDFRGHQTQIKPPIEVPHLKTLSKFEQIQENRKLRLLISQSEYTKCVGVQSKYFQPKLGRVTKQRSNKRLPHNNQGQPYHIEKKIWQYQLNHQARISIKYEAPEQEQKTAKHKRSPII